MGLRAAAAALLLLSAAGAAAETATFGTIELVSGQVSVRTADGRQLSPRVGDSVPAGAELSTGRDGELHVETVDSGLVALRPNTRLRVAEYRAEGDELDTQVLALLRGTFRSVTGWIGRHNAARYRVTTPTATIGVRGTDHEPSYLLDEDVAAAGEAGLEPGTYDKVNEGASFIESDGGRVDIEPDQAGFAHASRAKPRRLGHVPKFFKGTRHEKRIKARREALKKVSEQRREQRKERRKQLRERAKDRREQRKERRKQNDGD